MDKRYGTDIEDTIAATATPPGTGGVAIVRISGPDAEQILEEVFSGGVPQESARMQYGRIVSRDGRTIDTGYAVLFRDASYTGEPTAELQIHGGAVGTAEVLRRVLEAGARLAEPGEFTKRAFLNGRLDLSQAEAVGDLIGALSEAGAQLAVRQAGGDVRDVLEDIREQLLLLVAQIEAVLEYPDEDIDAADAQDMKPRLRVLEEKLRKLAGTAQDGATIRDGLSVVLAGAPNAGKSSLFNALCGEDRAIVTSVPGTTRDRLEHVLNLRGAAVRLTDTAGLRETDDEVENLGVERTRGAAKEGSILLFVVDRSAPVGAETEQAWNMVNDTCGAVICLLNKADLPPRTNREDLSFLPPEAMVLEVSAASGEGLEILKSTLYDRTCADRLRSETPMLASLRQAAHLQRAAHHIEDACAALETGIDMDFVSIDLRSAVEEIGQVTGSSAGDELIDTIFSKFCLGK